LKDYATISALLSLRKWPDRCHWGFKLFHRFFAGSAAADWNGSGVLQI